MIEAAEIRRISAQIIGGVGLAGALWVSTAAVQAAPIAFGSNHYDFIPGNGISWAAANVAASASVFNGVNGHLATITSNSENSFLLGIGPTSVSFIGSWLGGRVDPGAPVVGSWVVGPEAGQVFSLGSSAAPGAYSNWGGIEPNNALSFAYMNIGTHPQIATGAWADALNGLSGGNDPIVGYFVEYESTASAIPLPAAAWMFLTALGGLGLFGWRRCRAGAV